MDTSLSLPRVEQIQETANRRAQDDARDEIDYVLVQRIAAADDLALGELYRRYSVSVYNYLLRLVREAPQAEDLLQDVFIAIWRGAGRYRRGARVKTWIFRIAHHQAVSWLRQHREMDSLFDVHLQQKPAAYDLENIVQEQLESQHIQQALDQLSPKHRAVLELAFVQELSYAEIAEVISCPVGTVKSRIYNALQTLSGKVKYD